MSGKDDTEDRRRYQVPYSAKHPIPTVRKFREELADRQEQAQKSGPSHGRVGQDHDADQVIGQEEEEDDEDEGLKDTSQIDPGASDPKKRRKDQKQNAKERAEREVTDPVTHLPVTIQDFTDEALKNVNLDDATPSSQSLAPQEIGEEDQKRELQKGHDLLANRFPPPDFDALRLELSAISKQGVTVGLSGAVIVIFGAAAFERFLRNDGDASSRGFITSGFVLATAAGLLVVLVKAVRDWMARKVSNVFEDEVWDAQRKQIKKQASQHEKETTIWLNSLMGAVWPLVNPDLFVGLGDTLEDVMQASLPKFIRMVSVDDIGQGSEALRILGVRWLPAGAASQSVTNEGGLAPEDEEKDTNEKEGNAHQNQDEDEAHQVAQGMEAEEGDFINLEVAFAYRSRSSHKSLKERTKDMHLYLAFYLAGNLKVPVWVDLQGIIGTMRLRLQLTPDPPFFALCTITFLGQPKVDLSCVPISKHALNIMDVPFISSFVQSSVDAAMAEYVAPKSLTLDLKDMLAGDDFKKDTTATGIVVVHIKRGYEFKVADTGIPLLKDGASDPYVSVGWAKFGKVLWSTRIIVSEMEPHWEETCYALVTPEELNVEERLRIQLWDSDKFSADDDLGRIEVDLKQIMTSDESNGCMWHRTDGFRALKSGDNMPGKLEWSVGYYSKTRIQQCQFDKQTHDPEIRNMDQLKDKVTESVERKLREAMIKKGRNKESDSELEQQKAQELKTEQDAMIISAPPPDGYPSGLFALQIHNITGLELEKLSKDPDRATGGDGEEAESGEGLPSAYCTILVNHKKTYKTRTKPQNSKPFYNAGCERFIRDWRDCEVFVSVRDARLDEDDPLLGIVHLPLYKIFKERSQVMGTWPLAGGIGHGKIRLSMVWRSVQLQAPENLIGWDYGTIEVQPQVSGSGLPSNLASCKIKLRTDISSGKVYSRKDKDGNGAMWHTKNDKPLKLAVTQRYTSCLHIAFKDKHMLGDEVAAFCVLWLRNIPDEEEQDLELPVWKGDYKKAIANCFEEPGEKIGTLKLKLNFWAGLVSDMMTSDVLPRL